MSEKPTSSIVPYIAALALGAGLAWAQTSHPGGIPGLWAAGQRAIHREPVAPIIPAAAVSAMPEPMALAAPAPGPQRSLKILVDQVLPGGVIARPYETHAIAGALTRAGGGGNAATGYHRGRKSIFLTGLAGAAEGQTTDVLAYPQGTAEALPGRTLERWVYVRPAQL